MKVKSTKTTKIVPKSVKESPTKKKPLEQWLSWPNTQSPVFEYDSVFCANQWDDVDEGIIVMKVKTAIDMMATNKNGETEFIPAGTPFDNAILDIVRMKLMFTNDVEDDDSQTDESSPFKNRGFHVNLNIATKDIVMKECMDNENWI